MHASRIERVVIVGASLAGLRTAQALRSHGFDGDLVIIGAESHQPYNRPPLSKQFLAHKYDITQCRLRHDIEATWLLGSKAVALDASRRHVLVRGDMVPYDALVIATGASAKAWRGVNSQLEGIFTLRDLDDAVALRAAAATAERVVIVGAGFIGCEVASTLRGLGRSVDMIDTLPYPMAPLGPEIGQVCAEMHRERGVRLHLNTGIAELEGQTRLKAVRLADGTRIEADVALVAIGSTPNTAWLAGSGLTLEPGVVCSATCEVVGATDVFAAGDVARWPHALLDGRLARVEHWSNAAEQGAAVADNLMSARRDRKPFISIPSFWSDQYDTRIQSVGFTSVADRVVILEGSLNARRFVAGYERKGHIVGVVGLNMQSHIPQYRRKLLSLLRTLQINSPGSRNQ